MDRSTELKLLAGKYIDQIKDEILEISHRIHDNPELGFQEFSAVQTLVAVMKREGFDVELGVAGLPTAFTGEFGNSGPNNVTIGITAEYDALPGLGHACGHNIIASSALGAALALKYLLVAGLVKGRVKVFGTPAEEGGGGKVIMARAGVFNGVTAVLAMHPSQSNVVGGSCLALRTFDMRFRGRPAHSAASPELGINALDAVIETFNAINALRQHVKPDVRIHGIITDGGTAVNIVPDYAAARIVVRSAQREYLAEVAIKVENCARGAALQTGATLEIKQELPLENMLECPLLARLAKVNMEALGLQVEDYTGVVVPASSDLGDVSQVVPTHEASLQIVTADVGYHTEAFREAAASPEGDAAVLNGAKMLAMTALDLLISEENVVEVRRAFEIASGARA
jgi:amidohydrolase